MLSASLNKTFLSLSVCLFLTLSIASGARLLGNVQHQADSLHHAPRPGVLAAGDLQPPQPAQLRPADPLPAGQRPGADPVQPQHGLPPDAEARALAGRRLDGIRRRHRRCIHTK